MNIFLDGGLNVRIGDFGVAKSLASSSELGRTMIGTPYYLSPELVQDLPYNHKSDIWALGCTLFELCAQKPPFDAKNQYGLFMKIAKEPVPSLPGNYSTELRKVHAACMHKRMEQRPSAIQILQNPFVVEKARQLSVDLSGVTRHLPDPVVAKSEAVRVPLAQLAKRPPVPVARAPVSGVSSSSSSAALAPRNARARVQSSVAAAPVIVAAPIRDQQPRPPSVQPPQAAVARPVAVPSVAGAATAATAPPQKPSILDLRLMNNREASVVRPIPAQPAPVVSSGGGPSVKAQGKITVHRMFTQDLDLIGDSNLSSVSALPTTPSSTSASPRSVSPIPEYVASPRSDSNVDQDDDYDSPSAFESSDSHHAAVQWTIGDVQQKQHFQVDQSIFEPSSETCVPESAVDGDIQRAAVAGTHSLFEWQVDIAEAESSGWDELESEDASAFEWELQATWQISSESHNDELEALEEEDFPVNRMVSAAPPRAGAAAADVSHDARADADFDAGAAAFQLESRSARAEQLRRAIARERDLGACICDGGGRYATPARGRAPFESLFAQLEAAISRDESSIVLHPEPAPELLTVLYKVFFLESELAQLDAS